MDEIENIFNLINSSNDFFVFGVKGCGKTTLIRDLMTEMEIKYIRINCI
jgi:MoxR-like ATPase